MPDALFTFVEGLWLSENLPCSVAMERLPRSRRTAGKEPSVMGSGGGDEQQPWHFALDRRASLRIAAREFEMDRSHS